MRLDELGRLVMVEKRGSEKGVRGPIDVPNVLALK